MILMCIPDRHHCGTGMSEWRLPCSASVRCSLIGQIIQTRAWRILSAWEGFSLVARYKQVGIVLVTILRCILLCAINFISHRVLIQEKYWIPPTRAWLGYLSTHSRGQMGRAARPRAYFDKHLCMNVPHRLTHFGNLYAFLQKSQHPWSLFTQKDDLIALRITFLRPCRPIIFIQP